MKLDAYKPNKKSTNDFVDLNIYRKIVILVHRENIGSLRKNHSIYFYKVITIKLVTR